MLRSDDRILVTHVGSLPRPATLRDLLVRQDRGESVDPTALEGEAAAAIRHVVARQLAAGIDIGNDGEMPRPGFSTYVAGRMRGFVGASTRRLARDLREHPDFEAMLAQRRRGSARITDAPQCVVVLLHCNELICRKALLHAKHFARERVVIDPRLGRTGGTAGA